MMVPAWTGAATRLQYRVGAVGRIIRAEVVAGAGNAGTAEPRPAATCLSPRVALTASPISITSSPLAPLALERSEQAGAESGASVNRRCERE